MGKSQFLLDTRNYCFLCLKFATPSHQDQVIPAKICSFDTLCNYLKLNLKKVYSETVPIVSSNSLEVLEQSELKATLCEDCSQLLEKFSRHFLELEVAQMKLHSSLKSISDTMVADGKDFEEFQREMSRLPDTLLQLGIVKGLRKKTVERCSLKLKSPRPHVKLQRLKMKRMKPHISADIGNDSEPILDITTCDICNVRVADLSTHLYTVHFEMKQDLDADPVILEAAPEKDPSVEEPPPSASNTVTFYATEASTENSFPTNVPSEENQDCREISFKCKFCSASFVQVSQKYLHMKRFCPLRKAQRPTSPTNASRLPSKKSKRTPTECRICFKTFASRLDKSVHQKEVHDGRSYKCDYCPSIYMQLSSKNRHQHLCPSNPSVEPQHPDPPIDDTFILPDDVLPQNVPEPETSVSPSFTC